MSGSSPAAAPADQASPAMDEARLAAKLARARRMESLPLIAALVLVMIVFQLINGLFLSPRNLVNLLSELAPLAFIAMASTVMIVMGEIDLSLGSLTGLTSASLAALLAYDSMPWPAALVLTFALGIAISSLQGMIVVVGRVRSFAVTLAGYLIWYGAQLAVLGISGYIPLRRAPINELALTTLPQTLSLIVAGGAGIAVAASSILAYRRSALATPAGLVGRTAIGIVAVSALLLLVNYLGQGGGVPLVFGIVLAVATVVWIVLTRTAFGRHLYAVGGDLHASRESGINVTKVKWIGFAIAGALATCAGVSLLSYTGGANSSAGTGALLLAGIGATVVGGVSLMGGRGSLWGAFGGAILLEAVGNGLNLMSLSFYAVYIVEGLVVLAALLTDAGLRRRLAAR